MHMKKWSVRLGSVAGVEIRVHLTIVLLVAYLLRPFAAVSDRALLLAAISVALFFLSIVLHELAHALVARRFGVHTRSIVLWPLGGLALFSHTPNRLRDDALIAAAGPLANLGMTVLALGGVQR